MRMRWQVIPVALALLATIPAAHASASPSAAEKSGKPYVRCEFTPTPDNPPARPVTPPRPKAQNHGKVTATLNTNHGDIVMRLDRANAPCAVHNLVHLARSKFYDRTQCWRLTDYDRLGVLQCGDIFAAEVGGPGYKFDDELTGKETYPRGTVAMGNWGPDTNGSQFFLVHSRALISPAYTVLGQVTEGMDVLDAIAAGGIIPGENGPHDGLPKNPVHIWRVKITG